MATGNYLINLYERCLKLPFGRKIFSAMFARKAPYFKTIKPLITELRPNFCQLTFKKRKAVQNHIGTVHAIAVCNGMEMAMGALAEASIPKHLRWLPKGMNVQYLAKTDSDVTIEASSSESTWQPGDQLISVEAKRSDGTVVAAGHITVYVSEKPSR
ncbi:hotdog fold domain-containing protein [Idiomarina sp. PL1-037]|uniref:hotdog fold domain-containing protein n=1 Tax=unclassified Idiomarina TaxID=2614829 RepID=UPI00294B49C7|nr:MULTISPECIES: hotdog fold domain-containing protein [unclassified Idiomarina]MDV6327078.1 hotdog fold domain-containing protein [Idiomarina sp. Sol25]WQC51926.1 hotdog fold domain-containing protein [Idiomarina sp. PL1-037]